MKLMLASTGNTAQELIALLKRLGALPEGFTPPEGLALGLLMAWLLILLYMFLRLRRGP